MNRIEKIMSRLYIRWQYFLVRKNNIPLYVYITFCLLLYPLIDIWDAWLLWILLLWPWVWKFSFETTYSMYTQNWDRCIIWQFYFLICGRNDTISLSGFTAHNPTPKIPLSLHPHQCLLFSIFVSFLLLLYLIVAILWVWGDIS